METNLETEGLISYGKPHHLLNHRDKKCMQLQHTPGKLKAGQICTNYTQVFSGKNMVKSTVLNTKEKLIHTFLNFLPNPCVLFKYQKRLSLELFVKIRYMPKCVNIKQGYFIL